MECWNNSRIYENISYYNSYTEFLYGTVLNSGDKTLNVWLSQLPGGQKRCGDSVVGCHRPLHHQQWTGWVSAVSNRPWCMTTIPSVDDRTVSFLFSHSQLIKRQTSRLPSRWYQISRAFASNSAPQSWTTSSSWMATGEKKEASSPRLQKS